MKITPDRLAVAWAVQEHIEFLTGESFDLYPEEVIESLPEPPDDSECVVCTGRAKLCRKHDLPTPLTTDDSPATLPDAILEGEVKVRNYEGRVTARDLWVAELVLRRWGAGSKIRRGSVLDLIAAESPEPEPLPAPTGQGWPDWLSPEYQAIVKMVKDAMRRAEDDICNSEDASGLPRTAEGERNLYAGAIVHAFKRAGWMPPLIAPTAKGGA